MAKGDFLRALYEADATFYTDTNSKIASRKFKYEYCEWIVEYLDGDGNRIAVAREYRKYMGEPHVEVKDGDGNVLWKAYIERNVISDPNIAIYVRGSKEKEIFVSRDKIDRILEDYRRENGIIPDTQKGGDTGKGQTPETGKGQTPETGKGTRTGKGKNPGKTPGSTGGSTGTQTIIRTPDSAYDPAVPAVICCLVFLAIGLNAVFQFFYDRLDTVIRYAEVICVYASCPLMVILYLWRCRIKNPTVEIRRFYRMHLLMYTAGFAFLAYLNSFCYSGEDIEFFPQVSDAGTLGLYHYLLCFAPVLVYGIFSGIWTLTQKNGKNYGIYRAISKQTMTFMLVGSVVFIVCSQAIMMFSETYTPGNFGSVFSMVVLFGLFGLLVFISAVVARLPYNLLSKKF